jgi:sterol desaturase/sphingolipid hydroxylase (fatty acid hydroxylase superfamily)
MPLEKYWVVIFSTAIKFFMGPAAGLGLGLSWLETAICTIVGMMFTVLIVVLLSNQVANVIQYFRKEKPKLFSKRTRFAVRLWKKMGIWGLACLTPLFFTPVGGTLLALSFKVNKLTIVASMLFFAVFWGITITFLLYQIPFLQDYFVH